MTPILYAIVPLFNEEPNVPSLFACLSQLGEAVAPEFELLVLFVDDGSSDGTADRLRANEATFSREILSNPANLGPGAAFATGFSWLNSKVRPDDWVLTMEGDSTSTPDAILHMLRRRLEGYDVVLASPYMYGGGFSQVSVLRVLISHVANGLVKLRLGIGGILTFSCFLRAYSGACVIQLQERYGPAIVATRGFESMVELLAKIVGMNFSVSEVPMRVDGSARKGKSKMKVLKTVAGYGRLFVRWKTFSRPVTTS